MLSHLQLSATVFSKNKYFTRCHIPVRQKKRFCWFFHPIGKAAIQCCCGHAGGEGSQFKWDGTWMQFPGRSKLCKARPAHHIFLLVEEEVPPSCYKQNWFRRDLSKNWLRVLENTLFCSVGCWVLVKECSGAELPTVQDIHTSPTTQLWGGFVLFPLNGNTKPCQRLAWKYK